MWNEAEKRKAHETRTDYEAQKKVGAQDEAELIQVRI